MKKIKNAYKSLSGTLKTGDIILFCGGSGISKVIEKLEHTQWSHVGMIVLPEDIKPIMECENKPILWQSSPALNIREVQNKPGSCGPELVYLDELLSLLKNYHYTVAVRRLDAHRTETMLSNLNSFISKVHMEGFPSIRKLAVEFLKATLKEKTTHAIIKILRLLKQLAGLFKKKQTEFLCCKAGTFFCSELIAQSYIEMGLLPAYEVAGSYSPKSFSSQGNLVLSNNAHLENEIFIVF